MEPVSAVDVAEKQRHLYLLQKVKELKTLSPAELKELENYEQMKKPENKKTNDKAEKKDSAAVPPPVRYQIREETFKKLAMTGKTISEVQELLQHQLKSTLDDLFTAKPKLRKAWNRGVFLWNLSQLALTTLSLPEVETKLNLQNGQLNKIFKTDIEAAEIWNRSRIDKIVEIELKLIDQAGQGNPTAIKKVADNLKRNLIMKQGSDFSAVTQKELCDIVKVSRMTVRNWFHDSGLPRNADGTYNLTTVIEWYKGYILKISGPIKNAETNSLQEGKAKLLQLEFAKRRGEVLDRSIVMAGTLARLQQLTDSLTKGVDELALTCTGQTTEQINELLNAFFLNIRRQQCQVPDELQLSPDMTKRFSDMLLEIAKLEKINE